MDDTFAHIDWSKPNSELAVDLKIICEPDSYMGYRTFSALLGEPEEDPPYWMHCWAMTRDEAIEQLVIDIHDKFSPDTVAA